MQRVTKLRLDADAVVDGSPDSLLAAQVSFGSLHGHMPKKKLNLLQFSAGCMTQLRTRPAQIMRRQLGKAGLSRVLFYDMPDKSFRDAVAPMFACPTDTSEQSSGRDPGCGLPEVDHRLTHSGIGTVRMCPPLPMRSTMAQCSSRCCKCAKSNTANSRRRSPQPSKIARIDRCDSLLDCGGIGPFLALVRNSPRRNSAPYTTSANA